MKRLTFCTSLMFALLAFTASHAFGSLIVNGDFETLDGRIGIVNKIALDELGTVAPKWDVYKELPGGWTSENGTGIEVQYNKVVAPAHSPWHYVELDSDGGIDTNSSMQQTVNVAAAGTYVLSYYYRARTTTSGDNGIDVYVNNDLVFTSSTNTPNAGWILQATNVDLVAGDNTIKFWATGLENKLGGFLDDISLTVPEPAAIAVWGLLGLAGAACIRRRRTA